MQNISLWPISAETDMHKLCIDVCRDLNTEEEVKSTILDLFINNARIFTTGTEKDGSPKSVRAASHYLFNNRLEYFTSQTCKALNINPSIFTKDFTLTRKPDPVAFLTATNLLLPNLDVTYLEENISNIQKAVNVLWSRLRQERASGEQSMLYLYSTEGMTGKSAFMEIMKRWAQERGLNYASSRVPVNQFVGDEYNKNAIIFLSDVKKEETEDWNKINDQIDGLSYVIEKKGKDKIEAKAQAFLIASSNFLPKDNNSRRIKNSLVFLGSQPLSKDILPQLFKCNNGSIDLDYYIPIVDMWLESCPYRDFSYTEYLPLLVHKVSPFVKCMEEQYLWILKSICTLLLRTDVKYLNDHNCRIPIGTLVYNLNRPEYRGPDGLELDRSIQFKNKQVYHVLHQLASNDLLNAPRNTKGTYGVEWDLTTLREEAHNILDESNSEFLYDTIVPTKTDDPSYDQTKKCILSTVVTLIDSGYTCTDFNLKHYPVLTNFYNASESNEEQVNEDNVQ